MFRHPPGTGGKGFVFKGGQGGVSSIGTLLSVEAMVAFWVCPAFVPNKNTFLIEFESANELQVILKRVRGLLKNG